MAGERSDTLSAVAKAMIDLCRNNSLDPVEVANVLSSVVASFVKQSGFSEEAMYELHKAIYRKGI